MKARATTTDTRMRCSSLLIVLAVLVASAVATADPAMVLRRKHMISKLMEASEELQQATRKLQDTPSTVSSLNVTMNPNSCIVGDGLPDYERQYEV